jgi:hypothetical protein
MDIYAESDADADGRQSRLIFVGRRMFSRNLESTPGYDPFENK